MEGESLIISYILPWIPYYKFAYTWPYATLEVELVVAMSQ